MNKKIYGNSQLVSTLEKMCRLGKEAHTVLFWGEKGSGRKTAAEYYCRLLMCRNPIDGLPCGICKSCRNIDAGIHPDIIYAATSGKLGGYSVDTAKHICSDAFVKPNDGDRKIYIFSDCHSMDVRTQNTLLKIIEEPPDYAYFIFTSESKNDFLPTIISRCVSLGVSECSEDECREALSEHNCSAENIDAAISCFHGNIGMCLEYIANENLRKIVELTKSIINSIIKKDEYSLAAALGSIGKERNDIKEVLKLLDKQIRDAAAILSGGSEITGCYPQGAKNLASQITVTQAMKMHSSIDTAWRAIEVNASASLAMSALCAEISAVCL